jgi:hypothetical protein
MGGGAWIRYWIAYARWWWDAPGYRMGDPALGRGEERVRNRIILRRRYEERKPQRPDKAVR